MDGRYISETESNHLRPDLYPVALKSLELHNVAYFQIVLLGLSSSI
jgi:hypothetical protein